MGRGGIRGLKTGVGRKCSISKWVGQIVQWRYTNHKSPRRKSQCYKQGHSRGAAPGMRAAKSSKFGEGEK